jgi:hypothetical protein
LLLHGGDELIFNDGADFLQALLEAALGHIESSQLIEIGGEEESHHKSLPVPLWMSVTLTF